MHIREKCGASESTLLDFANACSADLIVAGAYGHSRAQEWILGGMTQGLLSSSTVPLFLCH
jgi:nucleotide-binding universal stress UspA family protein